MRLTVVQGHLDGIVFHFETNVSHAACFESTSKSLETKRSSRIRCRHPEGMSGTCVLALCLTDQCHIGRSLELRRLHHGMAADITSINSRDESGRDDRPVKTRATGSDDLPPGVRRTHSGKYSAQIKVNSTTKHLGTFETLQQVHTVASALSELDVMLVLSGRATPCYEDDASEVNSRLPIPRGSSFFPHLMTKALFHIIISL